MFEHAKPQNGMQGQTKNCSLIELFQSIYTPSGFILEIGQRGSNGPPSLVVGGPFSRNGVPQKVFGI